ncbi:hypothetical protein [Kumtagia ephedrae]|uniref:hypothetical protein n=1 Tax=Kumtagia ephedrae TaxID=2116701 RepID=UPI001401CB84|nr:hypothetical protein [Mesorhizobium ephedrae]
MGIHDVGSLSLGQYLAMVRGWNRAHGDNKPKPPSGAEFDAAVGRARSPQYGN